MYVYFIRAGHDGPIKIGKAKNVDARIKELQIGNHRKLNLLYTLKAKSERNAFYIEKQFHKMFGSKRIHGEWFKSDIKLDKFMDTLAREKDQLDHDRKMLIEMQKYI